MKREYHSTQITIVLFNSADILTFSGEDDAIVKDGSWVYGGSPTAGWNE